MFSKSYRLKTKCTCDCRDVESLNGGQFHGHLRDTFAPQVLRYVELMESAIAQSIYNGFEKETWKPQGYCCSDVSFNCNWNYFYVELNYK